MTGFPDCFEMAGYSCHDEMSSTLDTIYTYLSSPIANKRHSDTVYTRPVLVII